MLLVDIARSVAPVRLGFRGNERELSGAGEIDEVVKRRNFDHLAVDRRTEVQVELHNRSALAAMLVEDWLDVSGRFRDDTKNLSRGRLIFQRLGEIAVRCRSSLSSRAFSIAITAGRRRW